MKYPALAKAMQEMEEGKLGIARDRLRGLVVAYPNDLSLRSILGDINMKLGYPREAGRWWFLDEDITEEKQAAIDLFIAECGNDPSVILRRLAVAGSPEDLPSGAARERIQAKIDECIKRGLHVPRLDRPPAPSPGLWNWCSSYSCAPLTVFALLMMLLGLVTFIRIFIEGPNKAPTRLVTRISPCFRGHTLGPPMLVFETARLSFRRLEPGDYEALYRLYSDPDIRRYFPDGVRSAEETKEELEWFLHGHPRDPRLGLWATIEKSTGEFLGRCGLLPWEIDGIAEIEIAYMIDKGRWGQGFGSEAASGLVEYAFGVLGLPRVIALIDPEHQASIRTAMGAGLSFEKETSMDGFPTVVYSRSA